MEPLDFDDRELHDIFSYFRMLVIRAGYGDWDRSMIAWLSENKSDDEDKDAIYKENENLEDLINYSDYFSEYLKIRSTPSIMHQKEALNSLFRNEDGEGPLYDAVVDNTTGEEQSLLRADENIDEMLEVILNFSAMLKGQPNNFLSDEDPEESPTYDR